MKTITIVPKRQKDQPEFRAKSDTLSATQYFELALTKIFAVLNNAMVENQRLQKEIKQQNQSPPEQIVVENLDFNEPDLSQIDSDDLEKMFRAYKPKIEEAAVVPDVESEEIIVAKASTEDVLESTSQETTPAEILQSPEFPPPQGYYKKGSFPHVPEDLKLAKFAFKKDEEAILTQETIEILSLQNDPEQAKFSQLPAADPAEPKVEKKDLESVAADWKLSKSVLIPPQPDLPQPVQFGPFVQEREPLIKQPVKDTVEILVHPKSKKKNQPKVEFVNQAPFYPPTQKTPGTPGDEGGTAMALLRRMSPHVGRTLRSSNTKRSGVLERSRVNQGTTGMPAGFPNNHLEIPIKDFELSSLAKEELKLKKNKPKLPMKAIEETPAPPKASFPPAIGANPLEFSVAVNAKTKSLPAALGFPKKETELSSFDLTRKPKKIENNFIGTDEAVPLALRKYVKQSSILKKSKNISPNIFQQMVKDLDPEVVPAPVVHYDQQDELKKMQIMVLTEKRNAILANVQKTKRLAAENPETKLAMGITASEELPPIIIDRTLNSEPPKVLYVSSLEELRALLEAEKKKRESSAQPGLKY